MKPKKSFPSESEEDDQTAGPEAIMAFDSSDDEDADINSSFIGIPLILLHIIFLHRKVDLANSNISRSIQMGLLWQIKYSSKFRYTSGAQKKLVQL